MTIEELLQQWEHRFRDEFDRDSGAQFELFLQKVGVRGGAREMLEGTVDLVGACAALACVDGEEIDSFLADQLYGAQASSARYELNFQLVDSSWARVLVSSEMRGVDFADLLETPWPRLQSAGYLSFVISRLDGAEIALEEVETLSELVRSDILYDYNEDEVSIILNPEIYQGSLCVTVFDCV